MTVDLGRMVAAVTLLGLFLTGCDDTPVSAPLVGLTGSPEDVVSDAALTTAEDVTSGVEKSSCPGTALQAGYAAFDSQCAFLDECVHAGSCFCGKGCASEKTMCQDKYCPNVNPQCVCGKGCTAGQVQCPKYICGDKVPDGCETHDDCVYNPDPPPQWCGCQDMPDRCFCGDGCLPNVQKCSTSVCKNYPTKGCTANEASFGNCYCQKCGLLGKTPKCYYLLCPG